MKVLLTLILLIIYSLEVCAQGFEIKYLKLNNIEQSLNYYEEKYKEINPNIREEVAKIAQNQSTFLLQFQDGKSKYEEIEFDSNELNELSFGNVNIVFAKSQKRPVKIFKDFANGIYYEKIDIFRRDYVILDSLPLGKWELFEEEKSIGTLTCKKAVYHDEYFAAEAWYTNEIPIPDGPEFYSGLPGLIVELKTKNFYYRISSINKSDISFTMDDYSKGNFLTRDEFYKLENDKVYQFKKMMEEGSK